MKMDEDAIEEAYQYLLKEEEIMKTLQPSGEAILVEWKNKTYAGCTQVISPEYSKEIVLLNKTSKPITDSLKKGILYFHPERTILAADECLDIEGPLAIVRRIDDFISYMTPQQTRYMENRTIRITDTRNGLEIKKGKTNYYLGPEDVGPLVN